MNQSREPDYDAIASALEQVDSDLDPVGLHGMLCGCLCADNRSTLDACLGRMNAPQSTVGTMSEGPRQTFVDLFDYCREQLNGQDCEFVPLLSNAADSIETGVDALGEWCQSFLFGLAEGGVRELDALSDDAREFANDLVEISRIGSAYHIEDNDEDALAFEEVVEYVRVGVLLINEELNPLPAGPANQTIH